MSVLVIGGAGYIGSNLLKLLIKDESECIVVDKIETKLCKSYKLDILNYDALKKVFIENDIYSIIYLANIIETNNFLEYYNNAFGLINVLKLMKEFDVNNIIYNSDICVYGIPYQNPITEDFPLFNNDLYAKSLIMAEGILKDTYRHDKNYNITILRYGSVLGGTNIKIKENSFEKILIDTMNGENDFLRLQKVKTYDESVIDDYIHVSDVCKGILLSLHHFEKENGFFIYNLSSGVGISMIDFVETLSLEANKEIPFRLIDSDVDCIKTRYLSSNLAEEEINFYTERTLEDICSDLIKEFVK